MNPWNTSNAVINTAVVSALALARTKLCQYLTLSQRLGMTPSIAHRLDIETIPSRHVFQEFEYAKDER
jgi:hypothetical protein